MRGYEKKCWVSTKKPKGRDTAAMTVVAGAVVVGAWEDCLHNKMKQSSTQILKCNPGNEAVVPKKPMDPRSSESHYLPGRCIPVLTWICFRETHSRLQIGEERAGKHGHMGISTVVALNQGHFYSPENIGNGWGHFRWSLKQRELCFWHLVGRGQGCLSTYCNTQDICDRILWPQCP